MPKDTVKISSFSAGLVSNISPEDIPVEAYCEGYNVDPVGVSGALQPLPLDSQVIGGTYNTSEMKWLNDRLLFNDGTSLKSLSGNTVSTIGTLTGSEPTIDVLNNKAYIGTANSGQWYGEIKDRTQLGIAIPNGWYLEGNEIKKPIHDPTDYTIDGWGTCLYQAWSADTNGYDAGTYAFAVSYIYDGFQESPLTKISDVTPTVTTKSRLSLYLAIDKPLMTSKRVSGVNLYMAKIMPSGDQITNFQLIESFDINEFTILVNGGFAALPLLPNGYVHTLRVLYGSYGAAYENVADQVEELESNTLQYRLSCQTGTRLVVADAKSGTEDFSCYLFFSRPLQPSVFDITKDFVVLRHKPVAICANKDRVFAFTERDSYIINLNSEYPFIEEVVEGIGCIGKNAVLSHESGIYHADSNGLYFNLRRISDPVQRPWMELNKDNFWITYDQRRNSIIFINGTGKCFVFTSGRWDYWELNHTVKAVTIDKHGEPILMANDGLYKLFASELGQRSMYWRGKKFADDTNKLFVYRIDSVKSDAHGLVDISIDTNLGSTQEATDVLNRRIEWFQPVVSIGTYPTDSAIVRVLSIIHRKHYQPRV